MDVYRVFRGIFGRQRTYERSRHDGDRLPSLLYIFIMKGHGDTVISYYCLFIQYLPYVIEARGDETRVNGFGSRKRIKLDCA